MKLENKQIKEILNHYDLGELKSKKLVYNLWNTSYKINTSSGVYLLKILNFQGENKLKKELTIIKKLKDKMPCILPIKSKEKRDYIRTKGRIVLIYPFITGKSYYYGEDLPANNLIELGKYQAIINQEKNIKGIPKVNLYTRIFNFFEKTDKSSKEYKTAIEAFNLLKRRNFKPTEKEYPTGLIHADLHTENLLVKNNKITAVFDFEEAYMSPLIYDIGIGIIHTCWKNNTLSLKRINLFLKGYESIRKLKKIERDNIINSIIFAGVYYLHFSVVKYGVNNKKNFTEFTIRRFLKLLKDN